MTILKEKDEQSIFVKYCELKNIMVVHVPNEIMVSGSLKNKYAYINSLKSRGMKKGFPDLIVLAKNSKSEVLFIEFKRKKGGVLSEEQKMWQFNLRSQGYSTCVVNGADEAIEKLHEYLKG